MQTWFGRQAGHGRSEHRKMNSRLRRFSFPPELYQNLEKIACQKKVSLAWVVRDAAEQYVAKAKQASVARGH
jgi:Ribbon-helix-helix protein, copG family